MSIFQAIILGVVQGLTELLPISSSAHLAIIPWLFDWTKLESFRVSIPKFRCCTSFWNITCYRNIFL